MKYSENKNFSTQGIRAVLKNIENSQKDYEDHKMGCAIETFEDILELIHKESLPEGETNCNNTCISHKYFGHQYIEEM